MTPHRKQRRHVGPFRSAVAAREADGRRRGRGGRRGGRALSERNERRYRGRDGDEKTKCGGCDDANQSKRAAYRSRY
jgi:hypothetical protein